LRLKTSCRGRSSSIFDATESNDTCRNQSGATSVKPLDTRPHHVSQRQRFAPAARQRNMTTYQLSSRQEPQCCQGCIKYRTIDKALNISVKQGISYRDSVAQIKKTYTEEKTRSTSTSSDVTQQTKRVQGAKKSTSVTASGTETIKSVPKCKKTVRNDDQARKERTAKTTPTLVSEANKSTSGNTSIPSTAGDQLREDQMLCLITINYNGDSIMVGSLKHTTDKRSTPSRQPTQRSSGHHQETEDEKRRNSQQ